MTLSIQDLILQRKQFVSDTYQFYTQHALLLDEIKDSIIEQISLDLEEESKLWNKWQKKLLRLNHFNKEIKEWMKAQEDKKVNQQRIIEISYLKSSFENQAEAAEKHYLIFLSSLEKKKIRWKEDIALYLIRTINQNTQHKNIKAQIEQNTPILKNHSEKWNSQLIKKIESVIRHANIINEFCTQIINDIESAKATESVDMLTSDPNINFLSTQKNNRVINSCAELSQKVAEFNGLYNFEELSSHLNINYNVLRESFVDLFSDSSMSGLRASLKIINKLNSTKEKILTIKNKMEYVEETFYPHYEALKEKKIKMINLCVNSQKLESHTAFKWIEANLNDIFSPIDKKFEALN